MSYNKESVRDNLICGILHLSTKVIYGTTKNGVIKKFTSHFPFEYKQTNQKSFYVKTKLSFQSVDVYAVIKLTDEILHNIPVCTVDRYLGNVGDIDAEQLYLTTLCTLKWANNKQFVLNTDNDLYSDRIDLTSILDIYSIDPHGCTDIDDAINVKKISESKYEIGVHISDVSSYIEESSLLDDELKLRGETVYLTDISSSKKQIQINMLPPKLTEICSLK